MNVSSTNSPTPDLSQAVKDPTGATPAAVATPKAVSTPTTAAAPASTAAANPAAKSGANQSRRRDDKRAATKARWNDIAIRVAFVIFLIGVWHVAHYYLVTKTGMWSKALFPSPKQVWDWLWDGFGFSYLTHDYIRIPSEPIPQSLWEAMMQKPYLRSTGASILRLVVGYGIAVSVGFPLGLFVARFTIAEKTIGWLAVSLQSLPSICWIPLAQLWLGRFGIAPVLFVTVLGALFATVVSVADGIRNVPPLMGRAGRTLGAKGSRLYFAVLLPAALPGIVSGLKTGWSFAWRSLMAAELIVNEGGLGFLLQNDRNYGDAEGVMATILVIIVIGLSVQSLVFAPFERRLQRLWGLTGTRS